MNRNLALIASFTLSSVLALFVAATAQAVPIASRVSISTISPCPSFCGGPGANFDSTSDGGVGTAFASASLSNSDGNGAGIVSIVGTSLIPEVGAQAFSGSNSRTGTVATGQRAYDYVGSTPTNITLDISFEGEAGAPVVSDAMARASVVAILGNDVDFTTDFGTLVFEIIELTPGLVLLGEEQISLPVNGGPQTLTASIPLTLAPGDRVTVWAQALTTGTRGGFADALNTLTMTFSDPSNLVAVPEPGTATLLLLGLGALARRARKA